MSQSAVDAALCRRTPKRWLGIPASLQPFRCAALAIALTLSSATNAAAAQREFFIAPTGVDSNPGTRAKPFATLEAARDAARQLNGASGANNPITVWIRGGTYSRESSFELTSADSGTTSAPVTYRSYKNEPVTLLGGKRITSWKPVADATVLARLPEAARSHVLEADLRAIGLTEFGEMKSRGFGRPITPAHCELFFDGKPMTLARWPNEGEWERIDGFPETTGKGDDHGGKIGELNGGFLFAGDRPRQWKSFTDVWVHGYWAWDWANSYERIDALDAGKRLIKTAPPHGLYGFRKGQRFYFLNVLEELDQPGEWFLDRQAAMVYFWPPSNAQAATASGSAMLSILDAPLISMRGASNITFRGIMLEATRSHGVKIEGGENNRVAACAIRNVGNYGVWIEGGRNHAVTSCDIENTGDGGVHLSGGDRQTLAAGGHSVENTHFQKQGRWSKCYVPAVLMGGVGHRVANNHIHDHPHCAILFSGNDHVIEFNDIHHVALETGDVGAIYTGRDWTYRGNRIRHNFIHETGGVGMGSMGVYMDDCVSGTEIFGNIFYRVTRAAFLGGGRDHRVENNIFVDCSPAVQLDGRGLDKSPVWHGMVHDYMKKQLAAVPGELYRKRYPAISDVDRFYSGEAAGVPPENNVVAHNLNAGGKWLSVGWHAKTNHLQLSDNVADAGSSFKTKPGATLASFKLKSDSPALRTGFQPIPVARIGLQKNELRAELKKMTDSR